VKGAIAEPLSYIHPELRHLARPIASVLKDPANVRRHDRKNIDAVKASLSEFGQRRAAALGLSAMVHRPGTEPFAWEDAR